MAWSMTAAVAGHAAIFGFWPQLELSLPLPNPSVELQRPISISHYEEPPGGSDAEGDGTDPEGEGADPKGESPINLGTGPVPVGLQMAEGIAPPRSDVAGVAESLLQDLLARGNSLVPTVVEGRPEDAEFDPMGQDEGPGLGMTRATADLTAEAYESLEGLSALDLERLAGIRPEVALEASSRWILVRNPVDVSQFFRRRASSQGIGARGSVSVAIWITAAGSVEWAEIIKSSGRSDLDNLTLSLFTDVVAFRPARIAGVPVPMSAIFTIDYP